MKLTYRIEDGTRLGSLLWEFGPGWRMISSAVLGGGIGPREWTEAYATVGLRVPTWAAAPEGREDPELAPMRVGTVNIVAVLPVAMTDAALVNMVMTVTEAKTQALVETGFAGTGTASDAVCVAVPAEGPPQLFGGPRSEWGARVARAVHTAVRRGAESWPGHPHPKP
ncbi:adenosylcobinamide amidohydrolase [Nonomuraea sp. MG754425]|uniref:adenosylcobinamide amidohydrolase n=1 Tax=Nonomuraea sp. MG754425 TaxID=2570319 RepID=UPI001F28A036|nr:adenosylcobinamide amidohydrolase [Nonomuraea sp. MG754425]MCF6473605.1 adenosylcobinamide amidohydrolase [Nonomuraea sp. MG754425]